jgi:hypothetical protein
MALPENDVSSQFQVERGCLKGVYLGAGIKGHILRVTSKGAALPINRPKM